MEIIYLLLLLAAVVCFGIAAFARTQPRFNLVAAGLLCVSLVWLLQLLVGFEVH